MKTKFGFLTLAFVLMLAHGGPDAPVVRLENRGEINPTDGISRLRKYKRRAGFP